MHNISYLHDILILLFASVVIVIVFKQIGLSPALGYLVAGAAIGPFGFGILTSTDTTKSIAELGIVFLLFAIGLELTFSRLMKMKKYVLGFGGLQVVLTGVIISLACYYLLGISSQISIIIGSALSMSSTAIVLQVISENSEQTTRVGRLSFSVLLMQDLAVIPILVLIPLFAKTELNIAQALGGALVNAAIALVIIFTIGHFLLRPIYRLIVESKSEVLFLSLTLMVVLGAAFLSHSLGLSFALGAFIAGLMVAETEYKYRVEEEILSLKSLLLGLFFMSIGMSFDFDLLVSTVHYIILAALALIALKVVIILALCRIFKFPFAPAIHAGLLLAQGGEFAFVVFLMAVQEKLMGVELSQFLMTLVTFTMALTPMLASLGRRLKTQLYVKEVLRDNKLKRELSDASNHVIIIGFSKIGRIVTYILRKRNIPYIVLESNHRVVRLEKSNGYNIHYGDPMNLDILHHIGIKRCESVIVALDDEIACLKITRFIHKNCPDVDIATKAENINNSDRFRKVGANIVVSKNLETGLQLAHGALSSIGTSEAEISHALKSFREIHHDVVKDIVFDETGSKNEVLSENASS
jgi:CPA2 family monovalent cation:H+ antiporter-2